MIRALIVDDEPSHVQGLIRHIRWTELGYQAPLTAESGEEALDILADTPIDVLITDVSMPGMTGIELVARCRMDYPHLQALMISGYNEFEFVQDAIHVGAKAYVLKPIKVEELEGKLTAFRTTLAKLKQIEEETNALQEMVNGSLDVVRERFVNDLIEGSVLSEDMLDSWSRLLQLPEGELQIRLMVFGYDRFQSSGQDARERVILGSGFLKAVSVGLSDFHQAYVAKTSADEVTVIHLNPLPSELAQMDKQFTFIQDVIQEQYNSTVTIGISRKCSSWEQVSLLYKEVKFMMARARLIGGGQILHYDRLDESEFQEFRLREEYIPEILKLVETGDIQRVALFVNQVFDMLLALTPISFTYVQAFGMGLLSELARKQKWEKEIAGEMNIHMWQRLLDCRERGQIREIVFDYLNRYMQIAQKEQFAQQHNLIYKIARYIEVHIQHNVTVKQLAELHHLNPSYLSVLFKKEMGKTISDFVQETRMNKAKELLQDPTIKIYEVAEQVGFQTAAYFTYLFKKTTGSTPQEFRDYH